MKMQIDEDIADATGLSANGKGKQKERQVPLISCNNHLLTTLQCTRGSTSTQAKEEPLDSDVDYKRALLALVNVLNKIEFHSQSCEKCKCQINDRKAWILDSGASQHFTNTKQDFCDQCTRSKNCSGKRRTSCRRKRRNFAKSLCRESQYTH